MKQFKGLIISSIQSPAGFQNKLYLSGKRLPQQTALGIFAYHSSLLAPCDVLQHGGLEALLGRATIEDRETII